jgi:hypothetical protein
MKAILCLLALLAPAAPARPLGDYIARRDFAAGAEALRARFRADSLDASAARDLARLFAASREYDSSLHWWNRALTLDPADDSAARGRWQELIRAAGDDSIALAGARATVAAEVGVLLAETTAATLTLAWDGLALADTARAPGLAALLAARFPGSPRGHELIGMMFYDSLYPVWTDDTAKIPVIRRFLARYPVSEWRQTFHLFLLSSLYGLRDTAGVRAAAAEAVRDDSLDPFRPRYAAAILNRLRLDPVAAEAYARRAIALEPTATKPPNQPPEQWQLDYPPLYGAARLALAEALAAQSRYDEAARPLREALDRFAWDAEQEATPGPFHCLLGEVQLAQGDTNAAGASFLAALQAGDSRNLWAARADTNLQRLGTASAPAQLARGRRQLAYAGPMFTDVTREYGLDAEHGSRVAWGDYDADGYDDLLLDGSRLYRNDSGRTFVDVTAAAGLAGARGRGGVWADFDNDGRLDFFASGSDTADRLWLNTGAGFAATTVETGAPAPGEGCAAADFDSDGWLDLYVANYEDWATHRYFPDRLYRNANGALLDRTEAAGITPPWGEDRAGRGVAWADFDDDGRPDCFVANYRLQENFLWWNRGDGTFANRAAELGIAGDEVAGWFGHTIGAAWADYDNDGDLDLFTADLAHPRYIEFSNRSRLYENLGPDARPRFRDRRAAAGIRYEETHSNPAWADVDNDGDLDLYITSIYEGRRSFLYENAGPGPDGRPVFRDVTWLSGTRVFNGWGCAFADIDNDGDLDLAVGSGSGLRLLRNDTPRTGNWLQVRVIGRPANRAGIGCRVTVERGRQRQVREVEAGSGTTSQGSLVQHVGLGTDGRPVTLRVRFGPGRETVLRNVGVNRRVVVEEP